ncbi:MAG: MaoC family dehydratase N-terminal domain-containing protein [Dehalococcoidia bacterium]|nr:MaoC family dehydratase N-terminal domain-containing protein [Dehalococcoidia bacterium]
MADRDDIDATDEEKARVKEMQAEVGKGGSPSTSEVTSTDTRLFARAVGYGDPIYYDEAAARAAGHRALPAPPGYTGRPIFNPGSGRGGGGGRDPLFPSGLNGGTEVEPVAQIYAGDVLTSVSTLTSVELLPSRAYKRIVVRQTETVYTNQDGDVVAKTRGTGISY